MEQGTFAFILFYRHAWGMRLRLTWWKHGKLISYVPCSTMQNGFSKNNRIPLYSYYSVERKICCKYCWSACLFRAKFESAEIYKVGQERSIGFKSPFPLKTCTISAYSWSMCLSVWLLPILARPRQRWRSAEFLLSPWAAAGFSQWPFFFAIRQHVSGSWSVLGPFFFLGKKGRRIKKKRRERGGEGGGGWLP